MSPLTFPSLSISPYLHFLPFHLSLSTFHSLPFIALPPDIARLYLCTRYLLENSYHFHVFLHLSSLEFVIFSLYNCVSIILSQSTHFLCCCRVFQHIHIRGVSIWCFQLCLASLASALPLETLRKACLSFLCNGLCPYCFINMMFILLCLSF